MTTIYTGNTTTTGFVVTADNSGDLVLKTGGAGGTTALTVGTDQRVTFAQPPLTAVPAFRAYADTSQNVTSGVFTLVEINNKTGDDFFDTNNWFDTSTHRFTPQIAGYYQFNGVVRCGASSGTGQTVSFYKNGVQFFVGDRARDSTSSAVHVSASTMAYMNGTTDYMELWGLVIGTSPEFDYLSLGNTSIFEGFLVRAT